MHYVFGLSVRPSVRPKPEINSFHLYMGPLVHPTNRDRFAPCTSVRPSVRPSVRRGYRVFAGEPMEGMVWNVACWCILGIFRELIGLWSWSVDFLPFWRHFDLVKWVKFGVSGHFPENAWWEWPKSLYVDVSWPPIELISLCLRSVDFSNLGVFLLGEMGQIWGFRAFNGEPFKEMAWNFACWCILSTFRTD